MNLEAWDDGMLRQRRRVEDPGVRNNRLERTKVFVAQLASPVFVQWLKPEKGKPHFLLEIGLERRRHRELAAARGLHQRADTRQIWQVK